MRPGVAILLALGLLGSDLVGASVCRPQSSSSVVTSASLTASTDTAQASSSPSTATESSSVSTTISVASSDTSQATTSEISSSTSTESASTSSSEVALESSTTFTTKTTTAESVTSSSSELSSESSTTLSESTTASTTVESSTVQTTTTELATTYSSTTEPSTVTSTSSSSAAIPTFNLIVTGNNIDGQYVKNDATGGGMFSLLLPTASDYEAVAVYVEEGTGHLKTLISDYYLCIGYQWSYTEYDVLPAYVQLCNTWSLENDGANRIKYITCELTGENELSCSAPGGYCYNWVEGPRDTVRGRCDTVTGTTFTKFFARSDDDFENYLVYLGPDESFDGYTSVSVTRIPVLELDEEP